ncbi:hypothetical protein EVJ50_11485 [Synechococcus sp. RSCCF101]|uniref:hypothetical protein n=1 Tax=Synechococcus sp. RSCCF101 TaxID=2511069 RepID=UPI001247B0A9|nr:hypothetical protein [Synechococcus sp. RSCCF101]QEY32755.1 hypothetical protein EVJ50_11485 [Synechococcus sp. RSCCF101]
MARTTVVALNGGLSAYRPAQCMFASPVPGSNLCLVQDDADGFLFHFVGGSPAWEQQNRLPTVESEIRIAPQGREVSEVLYNGTPRPASLAINVARTRAVERNGGMAAYEPGRCMQAPAATRSNPCVTGIDGSGYRFRFPGGTPGWQDNDRRPTLETELSVSPDGRSVTRTIYNGPPR